MSTSPRLRADAFLAGGGEMGELIRGHDWEATSLGRPDAWPQALRTALRLMLNTGHPMYIFWGPELLCFYNDAYRQSIGPERHPGSLGQPAREVWAEIWEIIGPQIDQVMAGQGATWHENQLVPITRNGQLEEVYWTYSYGPIDDETAPNARRRRARRLHRNDELGACRAHGWPRRSSVNAASSSRPRASSLSCADPSTWSSSSTRPISAPSAARTGSARPSGRRFPRSLEQGFFELLDEVYLTGEVYRAQGAEVRYQYPPTGREEKRYLDFIYAPLLGQDGRDDWRVLRGLRRHRPHRGRTVPGNAQP